MPTWFAFASLRICLQYPFVNRWNCRYLGPYSRSHSQNLYSSHHQLVFIPSALIVCCQLQKHVNGVIGAICCKLLILNQSLEVMSTSRKAHIEVRKLLYERYCVLKTHLHKKLVESISELAQNGFVFNSLFYSTVSSLTYNT